MNVISDLKIRELLAHLVDIERWAIGMVVGIVDESGTRTVSHGKFTHGDPHDVTEDSIFEIGSITKVFTSLLLMEMVDRGEVRLDNKVAEILGPDVRIPSRNGRSITLVDLATHTSGLPRIPANMQPANPANPFADYTREKLYDFLSTYSLSRDIGLQFEYSNLGYGLLGLTLAKRLRMDYEQLLKLRVLDPLGMIGTGSTMTASIKANLVPGHTRELKPTMPWDSGVLAGAGGLRSCVNELLKFLSAYLGYIRNPLLRPMSAMLSVMRPTNNQDLHVGLGWIVSKYFGKTVTWHNGVTGGYSSFLGYVQGSRRGIVLLANTCLPAKIDEAGLKVLVPESISG